MSQFNTVAELLSDPARWCQGVEARTADNVPCNECCDAAAQWCIEGACIKIYGLEDCDSQLRKVRNAIGNQCVYRWNDKSERTHAEVLDAVRRAGI